MIFEQNGAGLVVMEAEHGELTAGDAFHWGRVSDAGAGNGLAIKPTGHTWDKTLAGSTLYTFKVTTGGAFNLFFRVNTRGRQGKVWAELDGQLRAVGPQGKNGRLYFAATGWSWQDGYGNAQVTLAPGVHTLRLRSLTESLTIDRLAVVPAGSSEITVGMSGIGPGETGIGEPPVPKRTYTFADWLQDDAHDAHRVLLVELEHAAGTVTLGSLPYLDEHGQAFDDFLTSLPSMESSLVSLADSLGDIDAYLPPDTGEDWLHRDWRGHRCRWYYGDLSWKKTEFRLIAAATIEGIKVTGPRSYRWELVGDVDRLRRTYRSGETTRTAAAGESINWVCDEAGIDRPVFLNLDAGELDIATSLEATESSTAYADIKALAAAMGAYPRVNQLGELEIIKPDTLGAPAAVIADDDVQLGSVSEVDVTPACKRVTVEYAGGRVTRETLARTGQLDEELVIETALNNAADAQALADAKAIEHAQPRRLWSLQVFRQTAILREGDYIQIDHSELRGAGVIESIQPALGSTRGTIEVRL